MKREQCIRFAGNPNPEIRDFAVTCPGHLSRIHKKLDLSRVLPLLEEFYKDSEVSGQVEDALDDINTFIRQ